MRSNRPCLSGTSRKSLEIWGKRFLLDLNLIRGEMWLVIESFLFFLFSGEAIICYQCNSQYDPRCGDPFDSYSLGTVNCSFRPRLEHLSYLEPTICRKIRQKGEAACFHGPTVRQIRLRPNFQIVKIILSFSLISPPFNWILHVNNLKL